MWRLKTILAIVYGISVGMYMYERPLALYKEESYKITGEIFGFGFIYQKLFCKQLHKAASHY